MIELGEVVSYSNSVNIYTNYDGFQVIVEIFSDMTNIECACYLYSENNIISKSGYENNKMHVFPIPQGEGLRCKVYFRSKVNRAIKTSRYIKINTKEKLRYCLSARISTKILAENCEIKIAPTTTIPFYEKNGFQPRRDSLPYRLVLPINWLEDPFNDRNWMFQLQAWRMLDSYLNRANHTDLNFISKVINDWVQFEKNNKSKWLWYDMATGLRALKIVFYLKKCYENKVNHNISDLDYLLEKHLKHLSNPRELSSGNHGLFQLHGLKSLTYILISYGEDKEDLIELGDYANEKMLALIRSQLGSKGIHTENSPEYHFFTHSKIWNIVNAVWWEDLDREILSILDLGESAKSWMVFPDNRCIPVGDSATLGSKKNLRPLEKWPHTKVGNQLAAKLAGYAVVRTDQSTPVRSSSYLFLQGSFMSGGHKHSDDLSFILQEAGIDILIDSGKYGYQNDEYRNYFLSTRAHNTIQVDEQNTSRDRIHAYGSAIKNKPLMINGFWVLKAEVNHMLNNYTHERIIIYKPGVDLYVIDKLKNNIQKKIRSVDQWWHFNSKLEIDIVGNTTFIRGPKDTVIEVTTQNSNSNSNIKKYKGYKSGEQLIGWVSNSYLNYQPTPTLRITTSLNEKLIILTRFKIDINVVGDGYVSLVNGSIITKDKDLFQYLNS